MIDRLVELSTMGVDADLPEQRLHPEGPRLIWHDRDDQLADVRIAK